MDVTTMAKITLLVRKLKNSWRLDQSVASPIRFQTGTAFQWNHLERCITYDPTDSEVVAFLLHEAGHAWLNHGKYTNSIELLEMERDAWEWARKNSSHYGITIDPDTIDQSVDTYRDWLHARSLCPRCNATGVETARQFTYVCIACSHQWRVNEARNCHLRRYSPNK